MPVCTRAARLVAYATGLLLTGAGTAYAEPGDHIQIGDSTTITPSISTGVEFRTNSYLSVGSVQSEFRRDQAVPSFNFVLKPRLSLNTQTPQAKFGFDGAYELRKWFDPDLAQNLDRFSDFNVNARLDLFPKGKVGLAIRDAAILRNRESDNQWRGNALLTQLRNDLGASATFRVGPDFDLEAGFGWAWHNYLVPGADKQRPLNVRNTFAPELNLHWRFFPNTAFVVETQYQRHQWKTNWIPTEQTITDVEGGNIRSYGDFLAMPDSDHFKAMAGIRGRVTRHLVVALMAGWGAGRYNMASVEDESASNPGIGAEADPEAAQFDANVEGIHGLLGLARIQVDLGFTEERPFGQSIEFFYRKDFQDSFFTNYVHQNHLRAGLQSRWTRYLATNFGFGPRFEEYRGEVDRNDIYLRFDFSMRVMPTRYLSFDLGGAWAQRASSQTDVQYDNVQGWLLASFTY